MRVYREVMGTDNLPWEYDADAKCIDGRLRYVCDTGDQGPPVVLMNEDDAALAVHCVNHHERLVEALSRLAWACGNLEYEAGRVDIPLSHAEDLLAELDAGEGGEV